MTELKTCPFCGGNAKHWMKRRDADYISVVICNRCGASTGERKTQTNAIKAWNRRVGDEE